MAKNYVSVTGVKDFEEVKGIMQEFAKANFFKEASGYFPAVGFLVSEKTLYGKRTRNLRFPEFKELPALVEVANRTTVPVIHYNSRNLDSLAKQVRDAMQEVYARGICRHIQLNTDWPPVSEIEKIKKDFEDLTITLQVGFKAMDGLSIDEIAIKVASYREFLDYVLIDPSKGRGVDLDIDHSTLLYKEIKSLRSDYSIVFAGGLSGDNVEEVLRKVIEKIDTKDFSIDAEGKLRDKINDDFFGNDILNIDKVRKYLKAAANILGIY